jgi:radical SAM protein with 4Fe4S-binding SPASM domain
MTFTLSAPNEVRLELTRECNLRCLHCYNSSNEKLPGELSTREIFDVIDQLEAMVAFDIMVEGGEIFMRPDVWDILGYLQGKFKVGISTNGAFIDRSAARRLTTLADYVQISLDGADADTNDAIRGRGSFAAATAAVEACVSCGLPTGISMVLTRMNCHQIEEYVRMSQVLGVTACSFARLETAGRCIDNQDRLCLAREQFMEAQHRINAVIAGKPGVEVKRTILCFSFLTKDRLEESMFEINCAANVECAEGLAITADGDILPCFALPDFVAGNCRTDRISKVWDASPVLNRLRRISIKGKCTSCEHLAFCRGGCRAAAYQAHGDIEAPDPLCWYEKNHTTEVDRNVRPARQ